MMNQDDVVELYQEEELKSAMTQRQGACFIEGSPKSKVLHQMAVAPCLALAYIVGLITAKGNGPEARHILANKVAPQMDECGSEGCHKAD
ncbi:hypothetical protein H9L39_02867 [Fusarium oxysporum f. sp. albedinis]|nr:hypothetical protein H9L39_02867 [Fusarium oxysporum f. sp. albedinis]